MNVNVKLMIDNVIQIKSGIMLNVGVTVKIKKKMCAKKFIFGILVLILVEMVNI